MSRILAQVSVRVTVKDGTKGVVRRGRDGMEDAQAVVWLPVDPEAELQRLPRDLGQSVTVCLVPTSDRMALLVRLRWFGGV